MGGVSRFDLFTIQWTVTQYNKPLCHQQTIRVTACCSQNSILSFSLFYIFKQFNFNVLTFFNDPYSILESIFFFSPSKFWFAVVFFPLWQHCTSKDRWVWAWRGDSHGGRDARPAPGWRRRAPLFVSKAGLPQIHQAVQLPATGGAHCCALHTLPGSQGEHASGSHCLPHLHQVLNAKVSKAPENIE